MAVYNSDPGADHSLAPLVPITARTFHEEYKRKRPELAQRMSMRSFGARR